MLTTDFYISLRTRAAISSKHVPLNMLRTYRIGVYSNEKNLNLLYGPKDSNGFEHGTSKTCNLGVALRQLLIST